MKTRTIEVYNCDHCNKMYQVKKAAILHELTCFRNPANKRPCFECNYLTKKGVLIYSGIDNYFDSEPINIERDFLFCNKKQIFLYTPKNEVKGNFNHVDENGNDFENHPMPKECDLLSNDIHYLFE